MNKKVVAIFKYLFFLALGVFLVWWSIDRMSEKEKAECLEALKTARYILFVPVVFILTASHVSRSIRWKILMKPMGYQPRLLNTFFAVMVGYLANLAVPRLGEVLKCTILSKYEKVPPEKLVGTILVERAVDVVSLLIVFAIALITQASIIGAHAKKTINQYFLTGSITGLLLKIGALILILVLMVVVARWIFRKYQHHLVIQKIKGLAVGVTAGLNSIRQLENKWAFIFHSVFIWSCYVVGTYLGFKATIGTEHLTFAATFPVLAFASLGMIASPGGLGLYPIFIAQVMTLYGIGEGFGLANGNLQWAAQSLIILIVGFASLLALPYYNKNKQPIGNNAPAA